MAKEIAPSRKLAAKVLFAGFKILKDNGGSMRGQDMIEKIRTSLQFDEWEKHKYEKTGYIRWESMLHFFSIDCQKAGFLQKHKRQWILTPEGEAAMKLGPDGMLDKASEGYREWASKRKPDEEEKDIVSSEGIAKEEAFEQTQQMRLDRYQEQADEGLRNYVLAKSPWEFQKLVAALLEAMGYYISMVAEKGPDGGIDIIAYTDPLGTKQPRIIVQVKHRPDSSVPSYDIQRLVGTLKRDSDVGIFVTSGDFSTPSKTEAKLSGKHIELIDFDRFIELWIQYYDKMKDETKYMLPLHPVYFLGSNE
jgi:restriction system protein